MKYIMALFFALVLAACGGALPPPTPGTVNITCADVYNDGETADCVDDTVAIFQLIPTANAAPFYMDAGTITRSQMVNAMQEITNNTGADITGWVEMRFDAGCNGATEWIIMPKQAFTFPDNQTWAITIGGQCGDMPLGARTLTATTWQPDGVTEIGQVIVSFELVE